MSFLRKKSSVRFIPQAIISVAWERVNKSYLLGYKNPIGLLLIVPPEPEIFPDAEGLPGYRRKKFSR